MKEARYFYVPDAIHQTELPAKEALHALRVLRLKGGDEIFLMDGEGNFFQAEVAIASSKHCTYRITKVLPQEKTWTGNIHLAIAPTKMMDRIEWIVEKMTEIGFDELTFLNCQFSERRQVRTDRLEKIVVSAMKQSRKAWKPLVHPILSFREFIEAPRTGQLFIAHCYNEIARNDFYNEIQQSADNQNITIMIGPEGDFSVDEVKLAMEQGYKPVSLGQNRLRTETAGLFSVSMAQLVRRKF